MNEGPSNLSNYFSADYSSQNTQNNNSFFLKNQANLADQNQKLPKYKQSIYHKTINLMDITRTSGNQQAYNAPERESSQVSSEDHKVPISSAKQVKTKFIKNKRNSDQRKPHDKSNDGSSMSQM